jgi:hypothetical protein
MRSPAEISEARGPSIQSCFGFSIFGSVLFEVAAHCLIAADRLQREKSRRAVRRIREACVVPLADRRLKC